MPQPVFIRSKNNHQVILRQLTTGDLDRLAQYLHQLSDETKKRFGPHPFDIAAIIDFYNSSNKNTGFIAEDNISGNIIAYSIIKSGLLHHDQLRLASYGLNPEATKCCTFAPSVADNWQSEGIGKAMLGYILAYLRTEGIENIILWGGVQSTNEKAINFYKKAGFKTLGQFDHFGSNYDMMLSLNT